MYVIGIDVGKSGGISILSSTKKGIELVSSVEMPGSEIEVRDYLRGVKTSRSKTSVYLEKQHSMPKQGVVSTFNLGKSYGFLIGLCLALSLELVIVSPTEWQSIIPKDLECLPLDIKPTKVRSISYVLNKFPKAELVTPRGRWLDGKADSILIAYYGIQKELEYI